MICVHFIEARHSALILFVVVVAKLTLKRWPVKKASLDSLDMMHNMAPYIH